MIMSTLANDVIFGFGIQTVPLNIPMIYLAILNQVLKVVGLKFTEILLKKSLEVGKFFFLPV